MYRFASPWVFLLLPIFLGLLWRAGRPGRMSALPYSSAGFLEGLGGRRALLWIYFIPALKALAVLCLVTALARPQAGLRVRQLGREGVDIMLVLDASQSMTALDFKKDGKRVTRLEVLKDVVRDFVKMRSADRFGMVVFGDTAFVQCPLTHDHRSFLWFLDRVEPGMAGDGTALGDGLGIGVKRIKDLPEKSKLILLLTDGRNNSGSLTPAEAAKLAKAMGVKIHAIGIGSEGDAPFLVQGPFGPRYVYQRVDLDEAALKEVAGIGGGFYYRATDAKSLKAVYDEIDKQEKRTLFQEDFAVNDELYRLFAMAGILFLLGQLSVEWLVVRKVP